MEPSPEPVTFPAPVTIAKIEASAESKSSDVTVSTAEPSAPKDMPPLISRELEALNLPPTLAIIAETRRSASQILPNLYLSDALSARWGGTLDKLGITHIISILEEPVTYPRTKGHLEHLHIPVRDHVEADLLSYFEQTTSFIARALGVSVIGIDSDTLPLTQDVLPDTDISLSTNNAEGSDTVTKEPKVLVHCLAGMSRSATIVCAYLIATTPMNTTETIAFVKSKRSIIQPNYGFRKQLEQWERKWFAATGKGGASKKQVSNGIADLMKKFE